MKKIIMTASALLILGGGFSVYASSPTYLENEGNVNGEAVHMELEDTYMAVDESELAGEYVEYDVLTELVGSTGYDMQVVKDTRGKRVVLILDEQGEPQYKSVYMKKKGYLKVVDFDGGLVFNERIGNGSNDQWMKGEKGHHRGMYNNHGDMVRHHGEMNGHKHMR